MLKIVWHYILNYVNDAHFLGLYSYSSSNYTASNLLFEFKSLSA